MVSPFVIPQQRNFGYAKDLRQICKKIFMAKRKNARLDERQPGMGIIDYWCMICVFMSMDRIR
jgi:hypothetical protein